MPERTYQILLVDDDAAYCYATAKILENAGFGVIAASDYRYALEVLEGEREVDLLLTDLVMPGGINGFALARMARMRRLKIKLLYLTAYDMDVGEAAGKILRKPISEELLLAEIQEALS